MKKITVFNLIIAAVVLCSAVSCSSDEDAFSRNLTKNSQTMILNGGILSENFCDLNNIPDDVVLKMESSEIELFTKLSERFRINYSFLDKDFYKQNKSGVANALLNLYDSCVVQNITDVYVDLSEEESSRMRAIEALTPTEDGNGGASVNFIAGQYPLLFRISVFMNVLDNGYNVTRSSASTEFPSNYYVINTSSSVSCSMNYCMVDYSADYNLSGDTIIYTESGNSSFQLAFPPR